MDEQLRCCICGDPVTPPYLIVGNRVYCERHYATVNKPNTGFWRAGIAQIVGVGIVSAIVADDGVPIPANATNPFPVDATLRRGR